jgi:Ca-activated chloride channel homolog
VKGAALAAAAALALPLPPLAVAQLPTFESDTALVRLDVLAQDRGRALRGLTEADFEVRDNGVPQEIQVTPSQTQPWDVVVLLDTSESIEGPKHEKFSAAIRAMAASLRDGDQAALLTFADVVQLRSPMGGTRAALAAALEGVRTGRSTALFDALFAALVMPRRGEARPLLILLTDGRDTASWLSADEVVAVARASQAAIYAVSTSSIGGSSNPASPPTWASVARTPDDEFLRRITAETGGRLLHARSLGDLQERLAAVLKEIGTRYVIGYEPAGVARDGWHQVQVRLRNRRGEVVVRPGYLAAPRPGRPRSDDQMPDSR